MNLKYRRNYNDWTEKTINKLVFLCDSGLRNTAGNVLWKVECHCGAVFVTKPSRITSGSTKSCGCLQRLQASIRAKSMIGPKHPRWNPKLTDEDRAARTGRDNKSAEWRLSVYRRDGFKCQVCRESGVLNAHHLDGWAWCVEKRYDINNGITLCETHHKKFHHDYGNRNNTKKQFIEWTKTNFIRNKL